MTDNVRYIAAAQSLYGVAAWRRAFAEDSGLSVRQVQRIEAGEAEPSERAWRGLRQAAEARLIRVRAALRAAGESVP